MSTRRLSKKVCRKCFEYHGYLFSETEWKYKKLRCCAVATLGVSCFGEYEEGRQECKDCLVCSTCKLSTKEKTFLIFSGKKIPEWCMFRFEQEIMSNDRA